MAIAEGHREPRRRGRPPLTKRAAGKAALADEPRVEAVERALTILEAFGDGAQRLSLADIAARTGFYPSTILRLAASLDRFGYLHRGEDGAFRLGPTPLRLGVLYRTAFNLADYVRPALARLVERTGETSGFYVREGDRRICLYRLPSQRLIRHHLEEGAALPLDRGASGHVLSAFTGGSGKHLDDVRKRGFCISLGERDPEITAIAVPVFGRDQRFVGALGISGPKARLKGSICETLTAALVEEAGALTRLLGGRA